jgi:hypothetical protein
MAANQVISALYNAGSVPIARGSIVRLTAGVRQALLAQADSFANLVAVVGAAQSADPGPGGVMQVAIAGEAQVLLESGLSPQGGETVYVSATQAGQGTTVMPSTGVPIGIIEDASQYAQTGLVTVDLLASIEGQIAPPSANWGYDVVRYFFLDNENGDDTNLGYIDAPISPAPVFTLAQTATVAIKTFAQLRRILPSVGAAHRCTVLFRTRSDGGNYVDADGVTQTDFDWRGINGYVNFIRRGSLDLTNDAADRVRCGFIISNPGPNADGSWTIDASGLSASNVPVVGGGLPAEPGIIGRLVRFSTGSVMDVVRNSATEITLTQNVSGLVAGQTFTIERPGVRCNAWVEAEVLSPTWTPTSASVTSLGSVIGFGFTENSGRGSRLGALCDISGINYVGCAQEGILTSVSSAVSISQYGASLQITPEWRDHDGTLYVVGTTFRTVASCNFLFAGRLGIQKMFDCTLLSGGPSQQFSASASNFLAFLSRGGYFRNGLRLRPTSGGLGSGITDTASPTLLGPASTATIRAVQIEGTGLASGHLQGLGIAGVFIVVRNVQIQNVGANPAVRIEGRNFAVTLNTVTGSTGNTGVGCDITACSRVLVENISSTVTGSGGDVTVVGPAVAAWAGLATTNVVDSQNNDLQGTAGHVVDACKFVSNQSGGALAIGNLVRGNGTTNQVTTAFADAVANVGVVGAMVTAPASAAAGYMAVAGMPVVRYNVATPTPGAAAYLSADAAGIATTTNPSAGGTRQKLTIGRVVQTLGSNLARTSFHPATLSVAADG